MSIHVRADGYAGTIHEGVIKLYVSLNVHCPSCGESFSIEDEDGTSTSLDELLALSEAHKGCASHDRGVLR